MEVVFHTPQEWTAANVRKVSPPTVLTPVGIVERGDNRFKIHTRTDLNSGKSILVSDYAAAIVAGCWKQYRKNPKLMNSKMYVPIYHNKCWLDKRATQLYSDSNSFAYSNVDFLTLLTDKDDGGVLNPKLSFRKLCIMSQIVFCFCFFSFVHCLCFRQMCLNTTIDLSVS